MIEWHKIVIALIALDRIWERIEKFKAVESCIERRIGERRQTPMNIPLLSQLIVLVESLFEHHAPEIVAAATSPQVQTAVEQAVTVAAVGAVAQDPKVQAGIAAYKALQDFKAAINPPPPPPPAPAPGTAAAQ